MNKKTDFQTGRDESRTNYRLTKKTGGPPSSLLDVLEKKNQKHIRKYVTAYGGVDDENFQTQNLQGVRY